MRSNRPTGFASTLDGVNLGLTLAACIFVGFGLGWLADRKVGWETPWFSLVGALVGCAAGMKEVVNWCNRSGRSRPAEPGSDVNRRDSDKVSASGDEEP